MREVELFIEPCPICGQKPELRNWADGTFDVCCANDEPIDHCQATAYMETAEKAILEWNYLVLAGHICAADWSEQDD